MSEHDPSPAQAIIPVVRRVGAIMPLGDLTFKVDWDDFPVTDSGLPVATTEAMLDQVGRRSVGHVLSPDLVMKCTPEAILYATKPSRDETASSDAQPDPDSAYRDGSLLFLRTVANILQMIGDRDPRKCIFTVPGDDQEPDTEIFYDGADWQVQPLPLNPTGQQG